MKKKAFIVVNLAGFLCFLWNDINTLQDMGYEIYIAGNGRMKDGSQAVELEQLERMHIPFFQIEFDTKSPISQKNVQAYKQIKSLLKKENFNLVHCHTPIVGLLTRLAVNKFRRTGTKVIYTTHGFTFTDRSSKKVWMVYYTIEKLASYFSDAIITINHEDYNNAKKMHCKNVYCISGVGVDTSKYINAVVDKQAYRAMLGISNTDVMILSVGELSTRKNHQIIIKAIAELPDKNRYVYVICGREVINSGMEKHLMSLAGECGIKLILAGHRLDIPQINKCSDIAAIPSLREGLGLAGIEALASGIPLIGSDVQGIREYIIDGKTGILCDPNSVEEFAKAIHKLGSMAAEEKLLYRKECIKKAKEFDVSVSRAQMKKIYETVLE